MKSFVEYTDFLSTPLSRRQRISEVFFKNPHTVVPALISRGGISNELLRIYKLFTEIYLPLRLFLTPALSRRVFMTQSKLSNVSGFEITKN